MSNPILEVQDLQKRFHIDHLGRSVEAFDALTFTLNRGEFILVQGPNGVGKSTLLRCLFRSYRPTSGAALYQSAHGPIDLACAADVDMLVLRREEIGFVTQFLRPRPRVTAVELVAEPLWMAGEAYDAAQSQAADMLNTFGLKEALWHAYPTTFSGGEQQKVNLARALIAPRQLLLLDEPTASLDVQTRQALATRLEELKSAGVAMIGVLHHPEDVEGLVDQRIELSLSNSTLHEVTHVA